MVNGINWWFKKFYFRHLWDLLDETKADGSPKYETYTEIIPLMHCKWPSRSLPPSLPPSLSLSLNPSLSLRRFLPTRAAKPFVVGLSCPNLFFDSTSLPPRVQITIGSRAPFSGKLNA